MTSSTSPHSSLEYYRKQAKQLVRDVRAGERRAVERIRPQLRHIVSLADAQLVIAREHGFSSWALFQQSVAGGTAASEPMTERTAEPALARLVELLAPTSSAEPDRFEHCRTECERLRMALGFADGDGAAAEVVRLEAALKKLVRDDRSEVSQRASRALELLSSVIHQERIDLSTVRCSFCLKDNHVVSKLIRGSQGYICDACVATAASIIQQESVPGA